jgi:hypothetical protein
MKRKIVMHFLGEIVGNPSRGFMVRSQQAEE